MAAALKPYGPFAIPLLLTIGLYLILTQESNGQFSVAGYGLMGVGLIIYAYLADPATGRDDWLTWSLLSLAVLYVIHSYSCIAGSEIAEKVTLFGLAVTYLVLIYALVDFHLDNKKFQFVATAVGLIMVSTLWLLPHQKHHANRFSLGLPLFAIGWCMLCALTISEFKDEVLA